MVTKRVIIASITAAAISILVLLNILDALSTTKEGKALHYTYVIMSVHGLDESYEVGEPVSFTLVTRGISETICNHLKPIVQIVNVDEDIEVWRTPPAGHTDALCWALPFYSEWRFGYEGEDLPFQSGFVAERGKYENRIVPEKEGNYKLIARFDDHRMERNFAITQK